MLDSFLNVEKDLDLYRWKINKIPVWELVRFQIYRKIESDIAIGTKHPGRYQSVRQKAFRLLKSIFYRNPFFAPKSDLFLLGHSRRKNINGKAVDIYSYPLIKKLDKLTVLEPENCAKEADIDYADKKIYSLECLTLVGYVFGNVRKRCSNLSKDDLAKCSEIATELTRQLGTEVKADYVSTAVHKTISNAHVLLPFIKKLLQLKQVKLILIVVGYSPLLNQLISLCAKKLKIPTVELQHGSMGAYHIAYNAFCKQFETYPDYFFSWGSAWSANSKLPVKKENIFHVGFPHIEALKNKIKHTPGNNILFLSQYRDDFLEYAIKTAKQFPEYTILYKAHPAEYASIGQHDLLEKCPSNVQLINNDNEDLYELMASSKHVVGIFSTALLEATFFSESVVVLKLFGWETYKDFIDNELLLFAASFEDFSNIIINKVLIGKADQQEQFFRNNAIENMKQKICDITRI